MAALGIDWLRLLWQMINFVILLWLLQRLLFKPILRLMDTRAEKIRSSVEEAERIRAQAEQIGLANQAAQEEARRLASQQIEAAIQAANEIRERMLAEAREDADRHRQRALAEIELQKEQAIAELRRQTVDLVLLAAGKVIEQNLTAPEHYRLVNEFLAKAETGAANGAS